MQKVEKGFYYHYKHKEEKGIFDYAYEVLGVGHHTESNGLFIVYRPLYTDAFVYREGKMFDVRPLEMFIEEVEKDGKKIKRFQKIEDSLIIEKLKAKKEEMYNSN